MALLENLAQGFANAAGATDASQSIENVKADRRATAHEELEAKTHQYLNDVRGIQDSIVAEKANEHPDPKKLAEYSSQLAKAQQYFTDLYHPQKNPGALQHLPGFIKQHLLHRPIAPPKTPAEAKTSLAELNMYGAGAPQANADGKWKPLPQSRPYKGKDGAWYQTLVSPTGETKASPMPEGYQPPPVAQKPAKPSKGYKYDALTDQVVNQDNGQRFPRGSKDAPPEVAGIFTGADKARAQKQKEALALVQARGASYGMFRPIAVLDAAEGNAPTEVTMDDIKKNPGRYVPTAAGMKSLAMENQIQDIQGTSQLTRQAITGLQQDFPEEMKVKIALAMRSDDPHSALDQLIASGALGSLTPDQQDFLIATRQLAENAMSMRSLLGAGQGSEDMRNAIRATLPSLLSPDKSFATRQLDAFDKTVARLHRGVPRIKLNETNATPADFRNNSSGTKSFSVNGQIYDIPPDKVATFKKKYPNAQEQ